MSIDHQWPSGISRKVGRAIPMIDTVIANLACRLLTESGVDAHAVLTEAGIDSAVLEDADARIPFHNNVQMLEVAARHSGNDCLGLLLGAAISSKNIGVLGYVANSSSTVFNAIAHVQRYYRVLTSGEVFDARKDGNSLVLEYHVLDPYARHSRQNDDMSLMSALRLMRIVTEKPLRPDYVGLMHSKPKDVDEYHRLFGVPVEFGASVNAMAFPVSVLNLPIKSADAELLRILNEYCNLVLAERDGACSLVQQVEEITIQQLQEGPPKLETVARALGMSHRTLSRRLQEEGTPYREVVDQIRAKLAERYLRDRDLRVSEVAYLLGYTQLSAFNHAFKRWTGESPSEFRQRIA